jgi:hypothetical protein
VQFGTFLVRQGFIQERDLESVLLGQNLLRDGKITVAQFQVAMELSQSRGANIADTLIDHGYITAAEIAQLTGTAAVAGEPAGLDTPKIKEVAVKPRQVEQAGPTNLNASSAVPTWKDQLDWSKPLPADDDASLMARNPEKQSLAELLGGVKSEPASDPEKLKISNNAAPSWKDQLDWEQAEEPTSVSSETTDTNESGAQGPAIFDAAAAAPPQQEEMQNPISLGNAVPSWKDQLDWEQPKPEETSVQTETDNAAEPDEHAEHDEHIEHDEHTEHDEHAEHAEPAEHAEEEPEPSPDAPEGFFKKSFGKFKKGDAKDKKKKRK